MINFEEELKIAELPEMYFRNGQECYLDPFRRKLIFATPEEKIRQLTASYFRDVLKVPHPAILLEESLSRYGLKSKKRADIVIVEIVEEEEGALMYPVAVIECKAEDALIGSNAMEQVAEYADELNCQYVFITNGIDILAAKYDENSDKYISLEKLPNYKQMLKGEYELKPKTERPTRTPFEKLEEESKIYINYKFGESTPSYMLPFLTNFLECLLDMDHKLPDKDYEIFKLQKDYGVRALSYGNASGGRYSGLYRSFIVNYEGSDEIVSIGLSPYSTSAKPDFIRTLIVVAIDNERSSHHSLQLVVDDSLEVSDNYYKFTHSGKIAIGNIGHGKISELKDFVRNKYSKILENDNIVLGTIKHQDLLYLDDPEVINFMENLISYALIRDDYRQHVKSKD